MTPDERAEIDIFRAYQLHSEGPSCYVPLARIADFTDLERPTWERVLREINRKRAVHVIPESNQKVLTDYDREVSVSIGGEARHLISFDADYRPPTY